MAGELREPSRTDALRTLNTQSKEREGKEAEMRQL
jgi:hypothetical protein